MDDDSAQHNSRPQITPGELLAPMFTAPERSEEEPIETENLEEPKETGLPLKLILCSKGILFMVGHSLSQNSMLNDTLLEEYT